MCEEDCGTKNPTANTRFAVAQCEWQMCVREGESKSLDCSRRRHEFANNLAPPSPSCVFGDYIYTLSHSLSLSYRHPWKAWSGKVFSIKISYNEIASRIVRNEEFAGIDYQMITSHNKVKSWVVDGWEVGSSKYDFRGIRLAQSYLRF